MGLNYGEDMKITGWKEINDYVQSKSNIGRAGNDKGIEGNVGKYPEKQSEISNALRILNNPKNIIEIGFNAGHSSLIFLNEIPTDCKFYTFNLNNHAYSVPCFNIIKKIFNKHTIELIPGDSKKTIPNQNF